jgi:hypothetical protein
MRSLRKDFLCARKTNQHVMMLEKTMHPRVSIAAC